MQAGLPLVETLDLRQTPQMKQENECVSDGNRRPIPSSSPGRCATVHVRPSALLG